MRNPNGGKILRKSIASLAEAFFPENDFGAPDWRETEVVDRAVRMNRTLPPKVGLQFDMLYIASNYILPILRFRFRPMHAYSPEKRIRILRSIHNSRIYILRSLVDGLKAGITMVYMSHESVARYLGEKDYCPIPGDDHKIPLAKKPFEQKKKTSTKKKRTTKKVKS